MDQTHMNANYGGGFTYNDPNGAAPPTVAHAQPAPAYPPTYQPPPAYPSNVVMPAQQISPEMMMQAQMSAMMMMQAQLSPQQLTSMSPVPVNVKCPFCQVQMTTEIEKVLGSRGKILICAFTCTCFWCMIPCLWEALKDTVHSCSSCKQVIGTYIPRGGGRGRRRGRRR